MNRRTGRSRTSRRRECSAGAIIPGKIGENDLLCKKVLQIWLKYDIISTVAVLTAAENPGVAQLVARLTGGQEAVSSSLATRTI